MLPQMNTSGRLRRFDRLMSPGVGHDVFSLCSRFFWVVLECDSSLRESPIGIANGHLAVNVPQERTRDAD